MTTINKAPVGKRWSALHQNWVANTPAPYTRANPNVPFTFSREYAPVEYNTLEKLVRMVVTVFTFGLLIRD